MPKVHVQLAKRAALCRSEEDGRRTQTYVFHVKTKIDIVHMLTMCQGVPIFHGATPDKKIMTCISTNMKHWPSCTELCTWANKNVLHILRKL